MIELCSKTKLLCVNFIMYADASKSLIHYNYMIKLLRSRNIRHSSTRNRTVLHSESIKEVFAVKHDIL